MKRRNPKFRPPKVSDPPELVELYWIDAQGDTSDVEIHKAGGLIELPSVGYFVRYVPKGPHGPYIVIAMEIMQDTESKVWSCRQHTSIPIGWITRWSVVTEKRQVWPALQESDSSTSSARSSEPKTEPSVNMISSQETNVGVSPNAPESKVQSS